ncbi:hypothetical protein [Fuchsiella alkaliacetigena]|uniref:hypothetical protein n=1 Tax=Fuchsiella alkaliacetigena TaxID=957042 RepID=UPI00200B61C5|nr:hypothetical protein [Fuchsiella alkaliacetigena]MCK8824694.1 hypothetical protein [Fuchsiella alkaliacetigena]
MEKQAIQELRLTLLDLKEIEEELENEFSKSEMKLPAEKEGVRVTEVRAQLLKVYELKIKVLSELNSF